MQFEANSLVGSSTLPRVEPRVGIVLIHIQLYVVDLSLPQPARSFLVIVVLVVMIVAVAVAAVHSVYNLALLLRGTTAEGGQRGDDNDDNGDYGGGSGSLNPASEAAKGHEVAMNWPKYIVRHTASNKRDIAQTISMRVCFSFGNKAATNAWLDDESLVVCLVTREQVQNTTRKAFSQAQFAPVASTRGPFFSPLSFRFSLQFVTQPRVLWLQKLEKKEKEKLRNGGTMKCDGRKGSGFDLSF